MKAALIVCWIAATAALVVAIHGVQRLRRQCAAALREAARARGRRSSSGCIDVRPERGPHDTEVLTLPVQRG